MIRVTPRTNPSSRQLGFSQGGRPLNYAPLAEAGQNLSREIEVATQRRQEFELNSELLNEVNQLTADFERRKRDPNIDPYNFSDGMLQEYQQRHKQLLDKYWEAGYDDNLVRNLATRLGNVQQDFYQSGLNFQVRQLRGIAQNDIEDFGVKLSQFVANNPFGYSAAVEELENNVLNHPDLTREEKEVMMDQQLAVIRNGGAKALAVFDPQYVLEVLDPDGIVLARQEVAATGGDVKPLEGARQEVSSTLNQAGFSPAVIAGFLGNFEVEGGYGGALGDNGTASGIAQWRNKRRQNFINRYGKEPHQATAGEQAQFVIWEMNNPGQAGMTDAQRDQILAAKTPEEAATLVDKFYERSSGAHRSRRTKAAREFMTEGLPAATELVAQDAQKEFDPSETYNLESITTNDALIDAMNGPERLQLLGWAKTELDRRNAKVKAGMDVTLQNAVNELMTEGETAQPLPTEEEVLATYGPVEGPQRWAQLQTAKLAGPTIQQIKTLSPSEMEGALERLRPQPGSETYTQELKVFEAAQRAAQTVMAEREADPAAYVIRNFPDVGEALQNGDETGFAELDRAYDKLNVPESDRTVLPEELAKREADRYNSLPAEARVGQIEQWQQTMGRERFQRFLGQLEGTTAADDALIWAILKTKPNAKITVGNILQGKNIIANDPARKPSSGLRNNAYRGQIQKALQHLRPSVSRSYNEAAAALYVFQGGTANAKEFDVNLYRESLREAMGGVAGDANTGFVNLSEGAAKDWTVLPPGTNKRQFQNWKDSLTPGELTALSVNKQAPRYGDLKTKVKLRDIIDEGVFVMVSPHRYMIKMGSDGRPLLTASGQPFLINLTAGVIK